MKDQQITTLGRGRRHAVSLVRIGFALLNVACFVLGLVSGVNTLGAGALVVLLAGTLVAVFGRSGRVRQAGVSLAAGAATFWLLALGLSGRS